MAELRKDPIVERWVIVSRERGKRPYDFSFEKDIIKEKKDCPLCEGNEFMTPPEVFSYRKDGTKPNTPGWQIRVVPNKYPALKTEGILHKERRGIYDMMNGIGAHEVIIETPDHIEDIFSLEQGCVEKVILTYRKRMIELTKDPRFKYVLIFKNRGREAGASLNHSHSQLIATPVIPKRVKEEIEGAERYFTLERRCVFCDIIAQELDSKERLLWKDDNFISFCPFASRFPYEMWIIPIRHSCDFKQITPDEIKSLASMLKKTIRSLNKIFPNIPYNYIIHTSPARLDLEYFHWHLEIMPRLTKIAGFEWGTGFYINYMTPEEAAEHLRQKE